MLQTESVDSMNGIPGRLGRPRRLNLGAAGEHPAEPDRREDHRQGQPLAQHLDGVIAAGDVAHHDLAQEHALQVGHVGPHRRLLVGAAVDVVEQLTGEPPARQLAVVERRRRRQTQRPISPEAHGASLTSS